MASKEKRAKGKQKDKVTGDYTFQMRSEGDVDQSDSCGGGSYGL